ncbi:ABC transporter transmembrane domain-containing protein [Shimia sp. SDUM112013]|uniref:ABC transporter transmembrane domain-containing protein n=1 Tax=Shimia sp. SDUM112013 TaxID=3136160 RepID=UPI0032EDE9E4
MFDLYAAIWKVSGRQQILLILISMAIAALAAVPLNYQKDIINGLTDGNIDKSVLLWMCAGMMGAILLSLTLKWISGYLSNTLGEDVIRRIRNRIVSGFLDHPVPGGSGAVATMVSAEAEDLGKFTGSAFSEPVMQLGTLVSVIGFIVATQPGLGVIALCMIVPQVVVVLFTQRRVNALISERVHILRGATSEISNEHIAEAAEQIGRDFDRIYETRKSLFKWKLSTKFILSSVNGAGTVAVLLLGGGLVLTGKTDVGTVVAATMGLGRLQAPTAFLIAFYRQVSATRVKYELLRDAAGVDPRDVARAGTPSA